MTIPRPRAAILLGLLLIGSACARDREAATPPASNAATASALEPVLLPDLSQLAEPVQQQVRTQYASLTRAQAATTTTPADLARQFGMLGHLLSAASFFDEAVQCYRQAEAQDPAEVRWPYFLAHAHVKRGDREAAAGAFEHALTLQPSYVPAMIWLGDMNLDLGRTDAAEAAFAKALHVRPDSAAALFGAGRVAIARGAHADAVTSLEQALRIDPTASAVHYPLAMSYRAIGNRAKADGLLRRRGSRPPDLRDPLLEESEVMLESAVAHESRGMQALRNQDWTTAVQSFRRGLELDPSDPRLRYWLATAMFAAGDPAGAEREFTAVVREHPDFPRAHFSLGVIFERRGQRAEARREFDAAVRLEPNLPEARLRLAETERAMGLPREALVQYEEAVKLDPGLVEAWVGGAQALIALGDRAGAKDWIERALRLHPGQSPLAELERRLR